MPCDGTVLADRRTLGTFEAMTRHAGAVEGMGPYLRPMVLSTAIRTLLAAQLWPEASSITGDEGARGVIDAHPADRTLVEIGGDPPHDVDTEADYRRVRLAFEDRD